ncbi:MAG: glycosyltransferase family 4 protein [Lachnospiraceae bacterium]|nr:glycosyltransferase family 4 protein [Lachnospiraceae bacterium]
MDKSYKIIIIHEDGEITGGSAKIAIKTALGLSEKGYHVTYFCATNPVDSKLENKVDRIICLQQKDIASDENRFRAVKNGIWNRKAYITLSNLFEEYESKVIVHIHGWSHILSSSVFKACNKYGVITFVTLHDYFSVCPNGGFYNYTKNHICKYKPLSWRCIVCNCDSRTYIHKLFRVIRQIIQNYYVKNNSDIRFIYISNFSFSKIKKYLKSKSFYYLHNPIDAYDIERVDAFHNSEYLYIGRISPEKGVDLFCEAVHQLSLKGIVIGNGSLLENLKKKYLDIDFVGWKEKRDMIPYIQRAKCLIFPSKWYEGAPLTTEECLGVGIPCIVSDECAAMDQIIDGVNGYKFESENIEDLKKRICMIDDLKWNEFSNIEVEYSIDEYLYELIKIYSHQVV